MPRLAPRWAMLLSSVASLLGVGAVAAPVAGGCQGRECEPDTKFHGGGSLIDKDTYQTSPLNGAWLPFTHSRTWVLDTSLLGPREVDWAIVYISPEPVPNAPAVNGSFSNFTVAGGNLAEISQVRVGDCPVGGWSNCLQVLNATCANYYMRAVVHAAGPLLSSDAGTQDASADVASADGGRDAQGDVTTE